MDALSFFFLVLIALGIGLMIVGFAKVEDFLNGYLGMYFIFGGAVIITVMVILLYMHTHLDGCPPHQGSVYSSTPQPSCKIDK